jgi:unsaturated rhamnogalacturonyl hydrolase
MNIRASLALAATGALIGAAGGLALGLLLQRFTYPHIATWGGATAWGAAVGLVAALLAGAVMKPRRPWRKEARACLPAFGVGIVGVTAVMAAGAWAGMAMFDAGIERAFIGPEGVNPRRQTMAHSAWGLRHAAAVFGILLCAWWLCRQTAARMLRKAMGALTVMALLGATLVAAAPAYRAAAPADHSCATDEASVLALMRKVADWQLQRPRHRPTDWHNCPLHAGLLALYRSSGDVRYRDHLLRTGEALRWQLGPQPRLADDHCIGAIYLDLHAQTPYPRWIDATRQRFDALMASPRRGREEWWWCDALFMAPPVLARLAAATGQPAYRRYMDAMFQDTVDYLYDPAHQLFHRDAEARAQAQASSRPVFWGRGNAWVLAGLARTLPFVPADAPERARYEALFRDMAQAVLKAQQPDGFWRSSLLEPEAYPGGESSATALFAFALAWGVNEGLLPRAQALPAIQRAWAALCGAVTREGRLGWAQPEARAPGAAQRFGWETYASGALLMAGAQLRQVGRPPVGPR